MEELIKRYRDNGYRVVDGNGETHAIMEKKLEVNDDRITLYDGNIVRAEFWQYNDERHGESLKINLSFPTVDVIEKDPTTNHVKHYKYGSHSAFLEYNIIEGGGFGLRSIHTRSSKRTEMIFE